MESVKTQSAPKWAIALNRFSIFISEDFLGGPKALKIAWAINLHKFMTMFFVAFLMIWHKNYTTAAWVYLALHGTYGVCWLLKHAAFRDHKFEVKATIGGAVMTFILLGLYWVAPYLLISNVFGPNRSPTPDWLMALCISLFALGLTIMVASDCQKHFTLKYHKGLITDGMFRHIRHPNYLGEMLLYTSLALLVQHWIPWISLAVWWTIVFFPNMQMIEASISRYPGWEAYKARTGMLLPWRIFVK
jgi:protein-S-isoprenylcysteine O-methyltransferase Ste14